MTKQELEKIKEEYETKFLNDYKCWNTNNTTSPIAIWDFIEAQLKKQWVEVKRMYDDDSGKFLNYQVDYYCVKCKCKCSSAYVDELVSRLCYECELLNSLNNHE